MLLEFKNISKRYKNKYALKEVSFHLDNGVYGLLGTNGAGKTTLINIFMGILKSEEGKILFNGENVKSLGCNFLSKIGYLPQNPQFYKNFNVVDFMRYMCALKDIPMNIGKERIDTLLHMVNLDNSRQKKIGALSGGMRQRLGIAQAMLNYPDILILDEPTAGLDPQERIRFRNIIAKFSENRIILLATHIVPDVEIIANEVIMLKEGELIVQGTISELTNHIDGKVWNVVVDQIQPYLYEQYQVGNMIREKDGIHLRIISDHKPNVNAININPNLEDVFLYYCGEKTI